MPDWHALFGNASAAQVALWIVAIAAVIGLTLKAWPTVRRFVKTVDAQTRSKTGINELLRD